MTEINLHRQYRLNAPLAVSEVIDGEAVIMNMESGHYFSARGVAGVLWEWAVAGVPASAMMTAVAMRWPEIAAAPAVTAFLDAAVQHNLVVAVPSTQSADVDALVAALQSLPYQPPTLDVFTDMQDLLLLDPIHDVGEAGWPMPLPPGSTTGTL